jgi:NAD(P)-dependent dehydrogenase (short-subunit alcohol dehydrogenase family)
VVTDSDRKTCEAVLLALSVDPEQCLLPDNQRIVRLCSRVLKELKKRQKTEAKIRDEKVLCSTGLREHRVDAIKQSDRRISSGLISNLENGLASEQFNGSPATLSALRSCYICKERYEEVHHFYDRLCIKCGAFNFEKRAHSAKLNNMVAVVTGGRIKIGFQAALKLLRAGATVVATTRFPQDALIRYGEEEDFLSWSHHLFVYGLDLRSLSAVDEFVEWLNSRFARLHILINNAALTIERPPAFYADLVASEKLLIRGAEHEEDTESKIVLQPELVQVVPNRLVNLNELPLGACDPGGVVGSQFFPVGSFDEHKQQIDLRQSNSWMQDFNQVTPIHLLHTHLVNAFAPFYLLQQLVPLLSTAAIPPLYSENDRPSFVVNVSAVEGMFATHTKTDAHVHTNMAKASMNMITRTLADSLISDGIYLNSVDTGWVTNEFPHQRVAEMKEQGFYPPLDEIDGAARVCDPIFSARNNNVRIYGKLLKDFMESQW